MISELLVDLFCECRSCFVVRGFGFEKFQYTNATGLVYFHRFWHKYLRLMYSQATVRSYTKDRAVLRWDHTLKRGKV